MRFFSASPLTSADLQVPQVAQWKRRSKWHGSPGKTHTLGPISSMTVAQQEGASDVDTSAGVVSLSWGAVAQMPQIEDRDGPMEKVPPHTSHWSNRQGSSCVCR